MCIVAALQPAAPALADPQSPTQRLRAIEREIRTIREQDARLARDSEAGRRSLATLRGETIAAAALAQELEDRVAEHRATLAVLAEQSARLAAALAVRREAAARAVAALARLARVPPEAVMLTAEAPADTVRGARLAGALVPALADEVRALAAAQHESDALAEAARAEAAALARSEAERAAERDRLAALLRRRLELEAANADARAQAAAAIAERVRSAADLREALARSAAVPSPRATAERVAAERATREAQEAAQRAFAARGALADPQREAALDVGTRFSDARGRILPPVRGRIVAAFGQPDADGQPNHGVTFAAAEDAAVVAPFGGQVMFAGAFRSYGLVLILDHGEGYHSVILGLARLDATAGQWVAAGEPVGAAEGSAGSAGRHGIYLELRRAGQPIDPAGWLAASNRGERG